MEMIYALLLMFFIFYSIPIIWLFVPKFTKDNKIIKIIRIILVSMYIFPLFAAIFIIFLRSPDILTNTLSNHIFIYPIFIYAFMIKITFSKN